MSGHPARSLAYSSYVIPCSAVLVAFELALHHALVATVASNRMGISPEEVVAVLQSCFGLSANGFSIHRHRPEDFLLWFSFDKARTCITLGNVHSPRFCLLIHPWSNATGAERFHLCFRVENEIVGILDHTRDIDTAATLLSPSCLIEELAPSTRDRIDMSMFFFSAWTKNPDLIPCCKDLLVEVPGDVPPGTDPDRVEAFAKAMLSYPVCIFMCRFEEFRLPPPSPPPSHGSPSAGSSGGDRSHISCPLWPHQSYFPRSSGGWLR